MSKRLKIMLMTPPYHCGVVESAGTWMPLALASLAGAARDAGFEVEIYDAMSRFDKMDDIRQRLRDSRPDVVGITSITATAPACLEVLQAVKEELPQAATIIGGVHATFMYKDLLLKDGPVDLVVRGEGEQTLAELLTALSHQTDLGKISGLAFLKEGKVVVTADRPVMRDLAEVKPAWDLLEWKLYTYFPFEGSRLAVISTSRGCPHQCSFCSQQKFWKRGWRGRHPDAIIDELEMLRRDFGVDVVLFADEYPTPDAERWRELMQKIEDKKLGMKFLMETRVEDIVRDKDYLAQYRRAGLVHVYVGVEATDQAKLDAFNKGTTIDQNKEAIQLINDHDMVTETSFVLGMPDDTHQTIEQTLALAQSYGPDFAHFLLIAPWPYADLYPQLKDYIETLDYTQYNLVAPVARSKTMSRDQLMKAVVKCYRNYYMSRMKSWFAMPEGFKKDYLFVSMQSILKSSFLQEHLGGLGDVPAEVQKYMNGAKGKCPVAAVKRFGKGVKERMSSWRRLIPKLTRSTEQ